MKFSRITKEYNLIKDPQALSILKYKTNISEHKITLALDQAWKPLQ